MRAITTILLIAVLLAAACKSPDSKGNEWVEEKFFTKIVGNILFIFPANSPAYEHRDELISSCQNAVKSDLAIIKLPEFADSITIRFVSSRQEMKKYTDIRASGITLLHPKIVYLLTDKKGEGAPIKHELMHMILTASWGYPHQTSSWMNEGLAAYAENRCNGYNDEQIYRFLSDSKLSVPVESLTSDFYREPEMIAYHQAAFIAQYLLASYGPKKFNELWMQGFANFEAIYGISYARVAANIDSTAKRDYPNAPPIVWKTFSEGCE
jgi:hypothetical protein